MSQRRLAAIMFTDIAGYTALMQENEAQAMILRNRHREVFEQAHKSHRGQIVQYYGDGTLSVFDSAIDAAACAVAMQKAFQQEPKVPSRIGIHTGDIFLSETEVIGDGVNIASRVESMAVPGAVLVSETVFDNLKNQPQFAGTSLGLFTFKNVSKPMEVFALSNDGLAVPKTKELTGKFIKRESTRKDWFSRQPIWFRYVAGLVLFLAVAPFIYAPILSLFDSRANGNEVTFFDENGKEITRNIVPIEERKSLYLSEFEISENDSALSWAKFGIPYALEIDLDQDPYMYNMFQEEKGLTSLKELLEQAKRERCEYLLRGTAKQNGSLLEVEASLYTVSTGQVMETFQLSQANVLRLADSLSILIKQRLGVPESHLATFEDLPLEETLTKNPAAYQAFGEGLYASWNRRADLFVRLQAPLEMDSTFSWAAFTYATILYYYQRSPEQYKRYASMATRHQGRLPETLSVLVRQMAYKVNDQPDKALELLRLMTQLEPGKSTHWASLMMESQMQERYDLTLEAIEQLRKLGHDPDEHRLLEANCLHRTGENKDALKAVKEYLKSHPNDKEALQLQGELLVAEEEVEEARAVFNQGALLYPEGSQFAQFLLHCDYLDSVQGKPLALADYEGEYWVSGLASFKLTLGRIGGNLSVKFGQQAHIELYPIGNEKFTMAFPGEIEFRRDSTSSKVIGMFFSSSTGDNFAARKISPAIRLAFDAFRTSQPDAMESVTAAMKEHPEFKFLPLMKQSLEYRQQNPDQPDQQSLARYAGRYAYEGQQYEVAVSNGTLALVQANNQQGLNPFQMYPIGNNAFISLDHFQAYFGFEPGPGPSKNLLILGVQSDSRLEIPRMKVAR